MSKEPNREKVDLSGIVDVTSGQPKPKPQPQPAVRTVRPVWEQAGERFDRQRSHGDPFITTGRMLLWFVFWIALAAFIAAGLVPRHSQLPPLSSADLIGPTAVICATIAMAGLSISHAARPH